MFRLFPSQKRTVLGVDVRDDSISIVQLSCVIVRTEIQYHLVHYSHAALNTVCGQSRTAKDSMSQQVLHQLLTEIPLSYDQIVMAVPTSDTLSRILLFHKGLSEFDLESRVRMEALKECSRHSELYFDFKILGDSLEREDNIEVLLVVAKTDVVKQRLEWMRQTNCVIDVMDIERYALERVLPWIVPQWMTDHQLYIMLVNLDVTSTDIFIFYDFENIFLHNERIIHRGCDVMHVPSYQALVLQHVGEVMRLFTLNHANVRIDLIVLMGPGAEQTEFEALFEQHFSISTRIANPFERMNKSRYLHDPVLINQAPRFVMACGLALRFAE